MREIKEEMIPLPPGELPRPYLNLIVYMQMLTPEEIEKCNVAFNNALNVGVSTFEYGDRLVEEIIFNHVLSKIQLFTSLCPFTAFAEFDAKARKLGIYISPYYIYYSTRIDNIESLDETQLTGYYRAILKHELLHVMLKHLIADNVRTNQQLSNLAMDALINTMIPEIPKLNFPTLTPEDVLSHKLGSAMFIMASEHALKHNFTWEEYYDYLERHFPKESQELNNDYIMLDLSSDNNDGQQSNSKQDNDKNENQSNEKEEGGKANGNSEEQSEQNNNGGTGSGPQDDAKSGRMVKNPAYNTQGDIKPVPASELPEGVVEEIEDIYKESVERTRGLQRFKIFESLAVDTSRKISSNWRQLLRKLFKGNSILERHYSMKRLDRRTDLPPAKKCSYQGGLIYVLVDTSGSINGLELQAFASEVYGLLRKYKYKYKVFTYTAGLGSEVDIRTLRNGKFDVVDRGGTNVSAALEEILANNEPPDMFIVLTDLYDNVPEPHDFCDKQVVYVLTKDHNTSSEGLLKKYGYQYFSLD